MWGRSENFWGNTSPSPGQSIFNPYQDNKGTVVAIAGDDYAVIGADTRLSLGFAIETRKQKKLFKLSDKSVLGATGCWTDVLALTRLVKARMQVFEHEHSKQMSTPALAHMLATLLYYKRFFPYLVCNILAGLDTNGKGCVYAYDSLGHCELSSYHAGGSAGTQLQPLLDSQVGLKNRLKVEQVSMPKEKAIALLKDCFISAAERDIYTGDSIYILTITADGIQESDFKLRRD